jgi:hypothetical protein
MLHTYTIYLAPSNFYSDKCPNPRRGENRCGHGAENTFAFKRRDTIYYPAGSPQPRPILASILLLAFICACGSKQKGIVASHPCGYQFIVRFFVAD